MNPEPDTALSEQDAAMIAAMFAGCGYRPEELAATLQAERDVLGTQSLSQAPTSVCTPAAIQGLHDALALIPDCQKRAYSDALRQNPRVVELESPPSRFLIPSQYDFWQAAQRLVAYWDKRRDIFGQERYARPLILCSDDDDVSALTADEIAIARQGLAVVVPADAYHRPVLLFDRARVDPTWQDPRGETRVKLVFYLLQTMSECDLAVANGFVALIASEGDTPNQSPPNGSVRELVKSGAIPMTIKAMHLLGAPSTATTSRVPPTRIIINLLLSLMKQWNFLHFRVRCHAGNVTHQERLRRLQDYGLEACHIPPRLGGTCDPHVWLEQRQVLERQRYAFCLAPPPPTTPPPPLLETTTTQEVQWKRRLEQLQEWSQDYQMDQQLARLQAQTTALQQQQSKFQNDYSYLQVLQRLGIFLAQDYEQDRLELVTQLTMAFAQCLVTTPCVLPWYRDCESLPTALAEWYLTQRFVFGGRDASTQEWIFVRQEHPDPTTTTVSRNDDDSPTSPEVIRIRPGIDEIPGLTLILDRLVLALQGHLPNLLLTGEEVPLGRGAPPNDDSKQGQEEKRRRQERAKRIKLLKRL